jgi:predicted ATP-grasp superfamily ATP-dependent carboligase
VTAGSPRRLPPAIIVDGVEGSALSLARSLGRQGVDVTLLASPRSVERFSRCVRGGLVRPVLGDAAAWTRFLLGPAAEPLRGAVVLACSDAALEIVREHREELAARFVLDASDPVVQRRLLGKLTTYEAAREAGVPTPRFWRADDEEQVRAQAADYVYPLLVKPQFSHLFQPVFGAKYLRVTGFDELLDAYRRARAHDLEVMLLEEIPGPDDRLCSYYTYFDEAGAVLCDFTKRVLRRYPPSQGTGCYHVTDWNPEVRSLGLRLFRHVGLVGVGNVEFKRDTRDGELKVIECNARFTAANGLLVASGCDLGSFVYHHLAGNAPRPPSERVYRTGLHLWRPGKDLRTFMTLRGRGELGTVAWAASLAHRQVLPFFSVCDPAPSLVGAAWFAGRALGRGGRALRGRRATARPFRPAQRTGEARREVS